MCDEVQLARMAKRGVSRREFTVLGAMATIAACSSSEDAAAETGLTEGNVSIPTQDGTLDGVFIHPAEGKHPAVIFWPDIAGIRPAALLMARRLAGEGYAVIVANPYYRSVPAPQFDDFADFMSDGGFAKAGPWREAFSHEAISNDVRATVAWLDAQDAVDTAKGVGAQGYCMTGSFAVRATSAAPGRVKAACSFHGGGLVTGDPDSPHQLFARSQASYLIAIGKNDDEKAPGEKDALKAAAEAAGRPAEVEVYGGNHGWTVPDSPSYDEPEAERAWTRMLATYKAAL